MTPLERYRLKNLSLDQIVRYASTFSLMMRGGITRADIEAISRRSGRPVLECTEIALSIARYYQCTKEAVLAKILVMNPEQAKMFDDLPMFQQDFLSSFRLPFPRLWIDFSMDSVTLCGDKTYGVLLWERSPSDVKSSMESAQTNGLLLQEKEWGILLENTQLLKTCSRWLTAVKFRAPRESERIAHGKDDRFVEDVLCISVDISGSLIFQYGANHSSDAFGRWVIHAVNFISSPSVLMERKEDNLGYWRSRAASELCGRSIHSSDVYWLLMKKYRTHTETTINGYHHRFRYDVRGHFKSFNRGRMSGRVIWCPAHQRGLANKVYRPSGYSGITGP